MKEIASRPNDDGLRRDFAKWLSERNDPRGEFISTQYAMLDAIEEGSRAKKRDDVVRANEHFAALKKRSDELLDAHEEEWLGSLKGLVRYVVWHKGFPNYMAMEAEVFRDNADRIDQLAPTVVSLDLLYDKVDPWPSRIVGGILTSPILERTEGLYLRGNWGDIAARQIADSCRLENLKTLFLADTGIGPQGASDLLGSERLARLEELDLSGNPIGVEGALLLLKVKRLPRSLNVLFLNDVGFNDGAAALLAQNESLGSLEELSLEGNLLSIQGIAEIIDAPDLKSVILDLDTDGLAKHAKRRIDEQLFARRLSKARGNI